MRNVNDTLLYRWYKEVWNERRRNSIDELLAEDVIAYGIGPAGKSRGVEEFKSFFDDFQSQFKNVHVHVEDVISEDDMQSALCAVTATHTASGKNVEFSGLCMVRVKDGKIWEAWNNFDFLKMYQQLGHVLTPQ